MTKTYLGFFLNRSNGEEFVAPVQAEDATIARMELFSVYPDTRFQLLTLYSRAELEHVLSGIDRWPGLPSKVQAAPVVNVSKVTVQTGGLPPLPGQVQAKVEQVDAAQDTQPMPAWMQSFIQQQNTRATKAATAKSASGTSAMEQAMTQAKTSFQQQPASLIERLKAAKGQTVSVAPRAEKAPQIQAPARSGSVIDILKSMHK